MVALPDLKKQTKEILKILAVLPERDISGCDVEAGRSGAKSKWIQPGLSSILTTTASVTSSASYGVVATRRGPWQDFANMAEQVNDA